MFEDSSKVSLGGGQLVTSKIASILENKEDFYYATIDYCMKSKFLNSIPIKNNPILCFFNLAQKDKNLKKNNFNFSLTELISHLIFLPYNLLSFYKFHKKVAPKSAKVVFYVATKKSLLVTSILKVFLNAKLIFHAHNVYPKNITSTIFFKIFKRSIDDVIVVSNAVKDSISHPKKTLVYNPISFENELGYSKKNKTNKYQVASVSSLIPYKGIKYFLNSYEFLENKDISFNVFGDGYLKDDLLSRYKFANFHGHKNMYLEYMNIDILVVPSIEQEAFSINILEAMSFGIPVIATNIGAHKELIKSGSNGILVDIKSSIQIAKSIEKLIESRENYNKFSLNCYKSYKDFIKKNNFQEDILLFFNT